MPGRGLGYRKPVHVVIMGCGRVGSSLARSLEDRNHTVSVIDSDPDAFRRLGPSFNGDKVTGYGFDQEVLTKAGIKRADAFAAVSSGDNSNILAARTVRENFGLANVVARIYDPGRAEVYERLGIPTVASVRWSVDHVMSRLLPGNSPVEWRDPSGAVGLVQLSFDKTWVGTAVNTLEQLLRVRVASVSRAGRGFVPTSSVLLQDGDLVWATVSTDDADAVTSASTNPRQTH